MASGAQPYRRAEATGKRIAVIGSGPAGLACAHRLALKGHDVTIFESRDKAGGLNEYGIAAYKVVDAFAAREIELILGIGGIRIETGKALGRELSIESLTKDFDAVFLGLGLSGVNALNADGETLEGVVDAVRFIADLRQASDLTTIPVGRRIAVVGGGMTAIDAAVQSRLLGAEDVTILYRRGQSQMKASRYEQELATSKGIKIKHWVAPKRLIGEGGRVVAIECEYMSEVGGRLSGTGETFRLDADMVMKAIGQTFAQEGLGGVALAGGRIKVDAGRRTSLPKVWAGGDCVQGGDDLTVSAVADGREAAESIDAILRV
jgi:glutamate synthase (NADPH/NADH) small chain